MQKLLFLCTGNYYRSRFSEEYFNFHAERLGLPWVADSMGISQDFKGNGNVGPMSSHTVAELARLEIEPRGPDRFPKSVSEADLHSFDRIIAVSVDEHLPMLQALWPDRLQKLEYFDVEDLHLEGSETALPRLKRHLDELLSELQA